MMKILVLVLVSILTVSGYAYGQAPMARQGNMPADGKLSGKIIDSSTSQPVEYASIAIYRQKDSTLVNGVVTDAAGSFNMENLPYGRFYAVITFIGYQKKNVEAITITPDNKLASLGTLKLEPASTALNEVVVMGNGNQMEYKIDKKIVNISQNIVASGGTVVDALQNTPSVQTDVEGNLTLRGSSNFTVLIDGKPSVVSGSEALQQIPAGLVQNVEIITNPSAKYDAEGSAGIINVIMKKQKVKGFNGNVSLSAGTNKKYNESINLNYKYDKWNFTLGADYRDMAFEMEHQSERSYFDKGVLYKSQLLNGSGRFNRTGYGFRGGVDYAIDNKNSLSLTGRWGNRAFNRPMSAFYQEQFDFNPALPGLESINYITRSGGDSDDDFYSFNLDYTLNLNDKGHQLTASAYYSGSEENDPSETRKDTTDINWNILPDSSYFQRVDETGDEKEYRFKTDYTLPFNDKTKLEAGLQTQFDVTNSTHRLFRDGIEDVRQNAKLDFDQNINAAYATFSSSTRLFDYQLGLRVENENRKIESLDTSFLQLFPTVHVSRKLPWDIQVQASYTRRISRPRQWDLSPLVRYMDTENARVGNPSLSPELTDAYELNIQKKLNELSYFTVEGFYRKTLNSIQQFTYPLNNLNYTTSNNLGVSESIGAEAMLNIGLTKWWSLNGSGSVYNYALVGDSISSELTGAKEKVSSKSSTNWNLNANTMLRFKTGTTLQLNFFYNAPSVTAQGTRGSFYTAGLALRQDMLKRKASLTLQYRDFIGNPKMKNTTETPSLYIYNVMKRETNVFTVTFTYRINNYKAQNKRNNEEMNNGNDMGGDMDMM